MKSSNRPVDLAAMRTEYRTVGLKVELMPSLPSKLWDSWLADAVAAGLAEPNAMVVSTVRAGKANRPPQPSSRTVLCKAASTSGFEFYTNYESRKSKELKANGTVAATFPWFGLARQVNIVGRVEQVSSKTSDRYWAKRERGSQLGAWASSQSAEIDSYEELEERYKHFDSLYPAKVPRPSHWGGWRIVADSIEFWQGRLNRLHDRMLYRQTATGHWSLKRLSP